MNGFIDFAVNSNLFMTANLTAESPVYLELYKYLQVMSAEQIMKFRKIATGILTLSAFTEEEIYVLESKLLLNGDSSAP